jgi:hypothetical protein
VGEQRNLLFTDVRLPRRLLGVDDGRFSRDRHGLGDATNRQRQIHGQDLTEPEVDVLHLGGREALKLRHDLVLARAQPDEPERSGPIGHRG